MRSPPALRTIRQITRMPSRVCVTTIGTKRRLVFKEHLRFGGEACLTATPKPVECESDSGFAHLFWEAGRRTRAEHVVVLALNHGQDSAIETARNQDGQPTFERKQPDA